MKIIEFTGWEGLGNPILPNLKSYIHVSPDLLAEERSLQFATRGLACSSLPAKLKQWLSDKTRQEFIMTYLEKNKLPLSVMALFAHGFEDDGIWTFWNNNSTHRVRDWVHLMDGKHGLLILVSCNEGKGLIMTKKSLILQPSTIIGFNDEIGPNAPFGSWNMYGPLAQEIDDYTLEYELKQMLK